MIDIVIGTHRLLQKDIVFKDLGLLIIDEEHRFGVRHKERLKKLKVSVDVMTLTATPIPRTLHMALAGIRDLSNIETPPQDRRAIETYVTSYDQFTIREAIYRELNRGGQVSACTITFKPFTRWRSSFPAWCRKHEFPWATGK